ncbi:SCO-spondin-like [Hydractinia symbiolongicarpus]|uniref:SCO-spondin-like n=1 Tax=Hydractinia symbiolongicarpus TaxID=13093 RepID=UPI00254E8C2D|nr:SCO-spondin-like [Hydractinia symbiolongicarpus]
MAKIKQVLLLLAIMVTTSRGQQAPCSFAITVDGSSSVDANQFQQQKDFIKRLITRIDISGDSNAGLAQFASTSQIHIKCNDAATSSAFNTLVDGVNLMSGATCIKCGLDKAQELLSGNGCGRTGENKIIFLMVDGNENIFPNEVVTTATNLRNAGYVIYALAIGNVVDAAMVATLTGSSDRVFRTQFADLATYDIETLYGALGSTCAASTSGWASWGLWSACSATCDPVGVTPSRSRTRSCPSGATCPGSNTESESCNGNVLCPGVLSQWSQWSTCSSTCRATGANAPTRTRTRRCDNPSLGGNCGGASLTETGNCNDVSCTVIQWAQWGQWSACSATCDPVGFTPSRTRTRSCSGGSTCPGSATESGSCNANLACPGVLTQWTQWSACAATCRTPGSSPPVRTRTRSCTNPSLGGNCNNAVLVEREDCNTDACTGNVLSQWSQWGPCSATCQSGNTIPQQTRTRTCSGTCTGVSTLEQRNCNAGVSCNVISCSNANISYVIVIDSSSSVKTSLPDEWSQEKTFVKNFAAQLGLGTNSRIRVGVVNYGSATNIVATCDSTATSNLANFNALIDGLPRQLGGTAINDALLKARELYTGPGCNRAGELRVVLFLTDGYENIVFDDALRVSTENLVRSEALVYVGAIGPEVRLPELVRVTGNSSLIFTANNFLELSNIDAAALHPRIVSQVCQVGGVWGSWSAFGSCSISCGARGVRTRTRECRSPVTNALQNDCAGSATDTDTCFEGDCPGTWSIWTAYGTCSASCHFNEGGPAPTQIRTRTCVGATGAGNCGGGSTSETRSCSVQVPCPGQWSEWGQWASCSETCQSNVNTAPTQSRTRTCSGGTYGGECSPGSNVETRSCNARASCPGILTQWSVYGDCSATCQSGLQAPTRQRTRTCERATFGGNCNGALLVQNTDCNVEVACPGTLTQWAQWGACSENCQSNPNVAPTRSRTRQCVGASFGGNCGGESLTMTGACNVGVGCQGQWSNWGAYGSCSETCQSNVNTAPTQSRTRTCNGGTFGTTCPGSAVGTQDCNVGVACQGSLTQWSAYGVCSATCQSGLQAPTQQRTRRCVGATFGGNCNGALLVQTTDCNVEVACPGNLTQWAQWGNCSESCQSNPNVTPTRSRTRQCVGASFGGNCGGEILTMTGACNVGVGCQGQWSNWGAYGSCSETCQSDVNTNPTQSRTRTCNGGTFGTTCPGSAVGTQDCNVGVACQGSLTQWSAYGVCSATCQSGLQAPTQQRTRRCVGATFGGNCNGALLVQTTDCNVEVACPGNLTQWAQWGNCSESCQSNPNVTPTRSRTRQCVGASFGGNCGGEILTMTGACNVGVGCQGQWSNWGAYGSCSETCQSDVNTNPTQSRTRTCNGGTFGTTCPGSAVDTRNCNVGVACQGTLTQWTSYGACSATCQLNLQAPTQQRSRTCERATFGGNCNGAVLVQTTDCNVEVACPGVLSQWTPWSACSETCETGAQQTRTRTCTNTSFGGNCNGASLTESRTCNDGVPCQGVLTQWSQWSACSATCQLGGTSPTRTRTRLCQGATQGGNCGGAILSETENCNFQVGCPGTLTQWGPWNPCSSTCQANATITPSRARIRFCINTSFNGNCFGASLQQTESCNVGVICPVPGTWTQWGQWSTCSKTCDMGARSRSRTCTDPFPANAGNDCVGSSTSTSTCKIADCPVACPVQKRCNCSLAPQFPTTAPALGYFNIDDATIHAAINTLTYWTKEIQNQICESCNLQRLQVSVNTVTSHVNQVKAMIDRLNEIKKRLRDIINCNNNVFIGSELWALYDYLYTRCTMLNGVYTELSACKMRFEAANNSCKKYGWFHQLMKQVYRKW